MLVSAIVAMSLEGVIGIGNELPWHLRDDLRNFKAVTLGKPIIMGRKTFDSIGKPLPGRTNIVLSRDADLIIAGCTTATVLADALSAAQTVGDSEAVVIGGSEIYAISMPYLQRIYLTLVECKLSGDAWFP